MSTEQTVEAQQCLEGLEDERTIFRHPKDREHPYVMIAKATALDDRYSGMSWMAARHLLTVMLCMPDEWDFNLRHLAEKCGVDKDTAAGLVRLLIEAGYVVRSQGRKRGGRFAPTRYLVFEHPTVSRPTGHGPDGERSDGVAVEPRPVGRDILNTPDQETEYRQTELPARSDPGRVRIVPLAARAEPPAEEKSADGHLPPHMQLAVTWYKRLAKKTGKLIAPSGDDFLAAQKAVDRADLPTLLGLIEPYYAGDWWFTKHKVTKKPTYAFKSFLAHFTEMLEAAPAGGTGPPRKERRCPACNQVLVFGTGRFTRCRCEKAWEIGDGGELEDVSREES